ncbi:MAG: acyl-ACP--UDP-N-acetylglucosamine O-acyltransferase, partial [Deltaproteobacteria bacterium]
GVTIGDGTKIHPHSVLEGPELSIGKECEIGPYAVLKSHTSMGDHNRIYSFACVGAAPQDLKFKGEESRLEIGSDNTFRESVTLNRGTATGGGVTRIGNHNFLMAYVHIAHDCQIGDSVVMANSVGLAGHVIIEDHAILGGMVGISQFIRIGTFSYTGGFSKIVRDIPPFMIASGTDASVGVRGINSIGLSRKGVDTKTIRDLKEAYKILFMTDHLAPGKRRAVQESVSKIKESSLFETPQVKHLVQFIERSKNGIVGRYREPEKVKDEKEDQRSRDWGGVSRDLSC